LDFEPVEFDERGRWCTIQLNFTHPLLVSTGDFADEVEIYLSKPYFLRELNTTKR